MSQARPKRGIFAATVASNEAICREHFRIVLSVKGFPPSAPGQFVQLGCQPPLSESDEPDLHPWLSESDPGLRTRSLVAPLPLLRRPFSLAGARPDPHSAATTLLEFIGRAVGLGTGKLAALAPGDRIDLIGPLGNSFPMPAAGRTGILVGGGVGIPPMIYLAEAMGRLGCPAVAVAGATSADLLPLTRVDGAVPDRSGTPTLCVEEFARCAVPTVVASDDGTVGLPGTAVDALVSVLDRLALPGEKLAIYTCGPEPMMQAVTETALSRSIQVWVAMERAMACGIGTCQSCVCKVRPPGAADWQYKLVCTDGPVFDGRDLLWE